RHWARKPGAESTAALAKLRQDLDKFSPADQGRLERALAEASLRFGDVQEAERLWTQAAQQQPGDVRLRLLLFDLAMRRGDEETVKRLIAELQGLEGEEGLLWRYGEACRLLIHARKGDKQVLPEARKLLAKVAAQRPNWAPVVLNEADIDELEGQPDRALEHYLRALDLGEQNAR